VSALITDAGVLRSVRARDPSAVSGGGRRVVLDKMMAAHKFTFPVARGHRLDDRPDQRMPSEPARAATNTRRSSGGSSFASETPPPRRPEPRHERHADAGGKRARDGEVAGVATILGRPGRPAPAATRRTRSTRGDQSRSA
jgi:hypothetical protein